MGDMKLALHAHFAILLGLGFQIHAMLFRQLLNPGATAQTNESDLRLGKARL